MTDVSKDDFEQYEEIRQSGITNMFDVKMVCQLSVNLTREKCFEIMKHYTELKQRFGG